MVCRCDVYSFGALLLEVRPTMTGRIQRGQLLLGRVPARELYQLASRLSPPELVARTPKPSRLV